MDRRTNSHADKHVDPHAMYNFNDLIRGIN